MNILSPRLLGGFALTCVIATGITGCGSAQPIGEYSVETTTSLFDDSKTVKLSPIMLIDHAGISHLPDVKVSLAKGVESGSAPVMWVYVGEILELQSVKLNIDGNLYELDHPQTPSSYLTKGIDQDWSVRSFTFNDQIVDEMVDSEFVRLQIETSKGPVDKVFSSDDFLLAKQGFIDFRSRLGEL